MGQIELSLLTLLLVTGVAIPVVMLYRQRLVPAVDAAQAEDVSHTPLNRAPGHETPCQQQLTVRFFKLLLGDNESDGQTRLLNQFRDNWQSYLDDPGLYPRQPMVLPKLLQAMKSAENSSQTLVNIVLEDPGLTSEVLKLANSPIYRNTKNKVHSIDYALVMLGIDGLHALVCSTLTKPIFAKQKGDGFNAVMFWEWSLTSAQNAQELARLNRVTEPTVPYMLTLLTRLAELTILRICTRIKTEQNLSMDATSLIPVIETFRYQIAARLTHDWGFEKGWLDLLPSKEDTVTELTPLERHVFRAQRLGPEIASATILLQKRKVSEEVATRDLQAQGLAPQTIRSLVVNQGESQ